MHQLIRVDRSFILYCNCRVEYNGRAKSYLNDGNYLIIRKGDGSLLIHGGKKMMPINYQPPGAIMVKRDCDFELSDPNVAIIPGILLESIRGSESIKIFINEVINYIEFDNWSTLDKNISKTEAQLRDTIALDLPILLNIKFNKIIKEFRTPVGSVDIVGIVEDNESVYYHVIEVKRGKANIQSCSQIMRYADYFNSINIPNCMYIMSPGISSGVNSFIKSKKITWVKVDHH